MSETQINELTISNVMQIAQAERTLEALQELMELGKPVDQDHLDLLESALHRIHIGLEEQ